MIARAAALALAAWLAAPCAAAEHEHHAPAGGRDLERVWAQTLARPALAVGAAFDARGRLWLARVEDGRVRVSRSGDRGLSFGAPVAVNAAPERIAADGENRPKLAFGPRGELYVAWTQSLAQPFSGHVRFSRSLDDGRSFSAPLTVNDDVQVIGHRFESLAVDARGRVWLAWLDKRDPAAAAKRGAAYAGAAVYYSFSDDRGASFAPNRRLAEHSCECCRIALAPDADGAPVAFWRQVFGRNLRDHALARLDGRSAVVRATRDDWAVDACPHHGPALAIARDGAWHLAWYSGGGARHGLFYARTRDRGAHVSAPMPFGDVEAQAGHPQLLALGTRLWLAWKEFDGRQATIRLQRSTDGGDRWSDTTTATTSASASDHPLLVGDGARAFLVWNTVAEGVRVVDVTGDAP